ncbi:uncharacterized protein LOC115480460 [Microcaecilia unicolor]|uniref:Uncharacterized protein LOC115480460 n=1 Tax=Microcaecilia unicolor TaxID=1415580 RepID=A0A6P7ZBI3_9AMPH|nr:uncharacterized protein LOC115480460 [Microcaecilia unicolor]
MHQRSTPIGFSVAEATSIIVCEVSGERNQRDIITLCEINNGWNKQDSITLCVSWEQRGTGSGPGSWSQESAALRAQREKTFAGCGEGGTMFGISQKHQRFLRDRTENSPVTCVPGIGTILGHRLIIKDCKTTADLLNVYRMDTEGFDAWLKKTCRANKRQRANCTQALAEWMDCTCQEVLCPVSANHISMPMGEETANQAEPCKPVCY